MASSVTTSLDEAACRRCTGETGTTRATGEMREAAETRKVARRTTVERRGRDVCLLDAADAEERPAASDSLRESEERLLFLNELCDGLRPTSRTLCRRGKVCRRARKLIVSSSAVSPPPRMDDARRLRAIVRRVAAESDSPHSLGSGDDRELQPDADAQWWWAANGGHSECRLSNDESASYARSNEKTGSCATSGDDWAVLAWLDGAPSVRRQYSPSPPSPPRTPSRSCQPSAATADWTLRRERSVKDASTRSRHAGPRSLAHDSASSTAASTSSSSASAGSSSSSVPYAESLAHPPCRLAALPPLGPPRLAAGPASGCRCASPAPLHAPRRWSAIPSPPRQSRPVSSESEARSGLSVLVLRRRRREVDEGCSGGAGGPGQGDKGRGCMAGGGAEVGVGDGAGGGGRRGCDGGGRRAQRWERGRPCAQSARSRRGWSGRLAAAAADPAGRREAARLRAVWEKEDDVARIWLAASLNETGSPQLRLAPRSPVRVLQVRSRLR